MWNHVPERIRRPKVSLWLFLRFDKEKILRCPKLNMTGRRWTEETKRG